MEPIVYEVFDAVSVVINKDAKPVDIIKTGIDVLQSKPIDKQLKKTIIKAVINKIAHGKDGIAGTEDDRLSAHTVMVLVMLLESEMIDVVIDGIVATIKKKQNIFKCFKCLC